MKSKPVRQIPSWIRDGIETILVTEHNRSMTTLAEAFTLAVQHHQAGRLSAAEDIYRQILAVDPNHADALHLLGMMAHQLGRHDVALDMIRQAIQLNPNRPAFYSNLAEVFRAAGKFEEAVKACQQAIGLNPRNSETYNNLGNAYYSLGNTEEAISAYRQSLHIKPSSADTLCNLGNALRDQGQLNDAVAVFQQAITLQPNFAAAYNNLGNTLKELGQLDEASASFQRAVELNPDCAEAYFNQGNTFREQHKLEDAITCYQRALQVKPDYAEAYNSLGTVLCTQRQLAAAINCFERAIALNPNFADALNNMGNAVKDQGKLEDAVGWFQRALQLNSSYAEAYNNLGIVLKDQGKLEEAIHCFRRAIEINPRYPVAHSNLLLTLLYAPSYNEAALQAEHERWNQQHAEPLAKFIRPHANLRNPNRRLRIGYVSPDLTAHPVGRFMLPLLESHDPRGFEIYCYSSVSSPDAITARCRAHANVWRDVTSLNDEQLANVIRQDQIDILVDLSMHTGKNRLLVFARKPAPVQVTYLAYVGTTGLATIDYRLTDPYRDPPQLSASFYSEKTIYLPETLVCYQPYIQTNAIQPKQSDVITFGCLNNFCKVSPEAFELWMHILRAVPQSQLHLHAYPGSHRDHALETLVRQGIAAERLTFLDRVSPAEYMSLYDPIDIAIDPFPFAGGITTSDALWMGVPVVTFAGNTTVGRGGVSMLSNLGLTELIAKSETEYIEIAVSLANDAPRLAQLRNTLRPRMLASPLMDAPRFARNVEAAYRQMWQKYCAS